MLICALLLFTVSVKKKITSYHIALTLQEICLSIVVLAQEIIAVLGVKNAAMQHAHNSVRDC